jgi:hypothetical protein
LRATIIEHRSAFLEAWNGHFGPEQRANWRLIGRGEGILWPDIDEDVAVNALLGLPSLVLSFPGAVARPSPGRISV